MPGHSIGFPTTHPRHAKAKSFDYHRNKFSKNSLEPQARAWFCGAGLFCGEWYGCRDGADGDRCKCNGVAVCYQIVESQIDLSIFCQLILLLGWRTRTFENGPHPPSPRKMTPHRLLRWKPLETSCWHLRLFLSMQFFQFHWHDLLINEGSAS